MSPWVLVLVFVAYNSGVAATTAIDMPSGQVCERAAAQIKKPDPVRTLMAVCVKREP